MGLGAYQHLILRLTRAYNAFKPLKCGRNVQRIMMKCNLPGKMMVNVWIREVTPLKLVKDQVKAAHVKKCDRATTQVNLPQRVVSGAYRDPGMKWHAVPSSFEDRKVNGSLILKFTSGNPRPPAPYCQEPASP